MTKSRPDPLLLPGNCCVALFAKVPVPGRVKTRLIPALGESGACTLHTRLLERTLQMLNGFVACDTCLWLDQAYEGGIPAGYAGPVYIQQGEDLGARLEFAAAKMLASCKAVIFIGTDCPAMDADYLLEALALLQGGMDLVVGPARDGGYVLLGTKVCVPSLFRNISWGTPDVLAQTLSAADKAGLNVGMLPELADIDRPEDLLLPEVQSMLP